MPVAASALVLLLTIDDRYPGAVADGRQMVWTAVAMVESGGIGQARARDFTWPRGQGDAVSRYGMAMSFAQVPAAWLAPSVEGALGPGSSQPLFLIAPLLFVCAAAAAAGWIALSLGAGSAGAVAAVLLTTLGSPLGAYAALDLSEPLQAAALAWMLGCAVASVQPQASRRRSLTYAGLAGLAGGVAVLTKSSLLFALPFGWLPLLLARQAPTRLHHRAGWLAAGFTLPAAAWVYFELSRFGRLFASYGGEGFTHPLLDGAWRLLIGPNRGLLLYFPAALIVIAGAILYRGPTADRARLAVLGSLGMGAALLGLAAPWWAWHGLWGWGPRLLVPAIPALAAAAALTLARWPPLWRNGLIVLSMAINLPGLLQNAAPVTMFASACEWPVADAAFAQSLAPYARRATPDGQYRVAPDQVLETEPRASAFVLYPWFARAVATRDAGAAALSLQDVPWTAARPDISCGAAGSDLTRRLLRRPGWMMWGRGFHPDPNAPGFPGVYDEGLLDQVVRAQQLGHPAQALDLARKLALLAPDSEADAQVLESLRLLQRRDEAVAYLSGLSRQRRSQPKVNLVLALFERDAGNESLARSLLGSVAAFFPGLPARTAASAPLSAWPRDLFALTTLDTDQAGAPPALPDKRR